MVSHIFQEYRSRAITQNVCRVTNFFGEHKSIFFKTGAGAVNMLELSNCRDGKLILFCTRKTCNFM